jgi:hypothetical protein
VVGEALGVVAVVRAAREAEPVAGELEHQRVPPLAPPPLGHPVTLEHDVVDTPLLQVPAHHQPGLSATDHDDVVLLDHGRLLESGGTSVAPWGSRVHGP